MYRKTYTKTLGDSTVITISRYVADEGKVFYNGEVYYNVVDDITGFAEIDEPSEDATSADYKAALRELGVE